MPFLFIYFPLRGFVSFATSPPAIHPSIIHCDSVVQRLEPLTANKRVWLWLKPYPHHLHFFPLSFTYFLIHLYPTFSYLFLFSIHFISLHPFFFSFSIITLKESCLISYRIILILLRSPFQFLFLLFSLPLILHIFHFETISLPNYPSLDSLGSYLIEFPSSIHLFIFFYLPFLSFIISHLTFSSISFCDTPLSISSSSFIFLSCYLPFLISPLLPFLSLMLLFWIPSSFLCISSTSVYDSSHHAITFVIFITIIIFFNNSKKPFPIYFIFKSRVTLLYPVPTNPRISSPHLVLCPSHFSNSKFSHSVTLSVHLPWVIRFVLRFPRLFLIVNHY